MGLEGSSPRPRTRDPDLSTIRQRMTGTRTLTQDQVDVLMARLRAGQRVSSSSRDEQQADGDPPIED